MIPGKYLMHLPVGILEIKENTREKLNHLPYSDNEISNKGCNLWILQT